MDRQQLLEKIKQFHATLPKFPDGRINYGSSDTAPVMNVFVKCGDKVLLLKRSDKVRSYKGKWNSIGGYLDDFKPLREKVMEELREETGIGESDVVSVNLKEIFTFKDSEIGKTWITQIVLVELKGLPEIKLDFEHTEFRWISPDEIAGFDTAPRLPEILGKALA